MGNLRSGRTTFVASDEGRKEEVRRKGGRAADDRAKGIIALGGVVCGGVVRARTLEGCITQHPASLPPSQFAGALRYA